MGWGGGSKIFSAIIKAAKKHIPFDIDRKNFYAEIYESFADNDWDTEDECFGDDPLFKEVYHEKWDT